MRARYAAVIAAGLAAALVILPTTATPAQAAAAFAPGSSLNNPANAPILIQLGVVSGGGATAATGATAAAVGTGAAGTLGFWTVVGAGGTAVGLMTLKGVEEGLFIKTDPEYGGGVTPGQGPTVEYQGNTVTLLGRLIDEDPKWWCYRRTGTATVRIERAVEPNGAITAGAGTSGGNASQSCATEYGYLAAEMLVDYVPAGVREVIQYGYHSGGTSGVWYATSLDAVVPSEGYHGEVRTTVTCAGSSGTTYVEAFASVDVEAGEDLPVPPAACPAGSIAIHGAIDYRATGSTTWVGIGSMDSPGYFEGLPIDYPDCFNGNTECAVQLWRVGAGGALSSCGPIGEYCPSWASEATLNPDLYRCSYGPYALDLANCSMYRAPGVGVLPNDSGETDEEGNPVPLPIHAPIPDPLPNPVTNPETGEPVGLPGGASSQSRECFPTGWGVFNPIEWVLQPLRCAFEPTPSKVEAAKTQLQARWNTSTLGVVALGVTGAVAAATAVVAEGGCSGVTIPTGWLNRDAFANAGIPASFNILNACEGSPLQPWAAFSYVLLSGAMIVLAIRVLPGLVGRVFNFGGVSG